MNWWLSDETDVLNGVFDRLFGQVQTLHDAGAKRFAFLNVPRGFFAMLCFRGGEGADGV